MQDLFKTTDATYEQPSNGRPLDAGEDRLTPPVPPGLRPGRRPATDRSPSGSTGPQ